MFEDIGEELEFEDALTKDGSRVERESDGRRPTERRVKEGGSRGGNLTLLLVAHLGRSENGKPLQLTLTSGCRGNQPLNNFGGNIPPNGGVWWWRGFGGGDGGVIRRVEESGVGDRVDRVTRNDFGLRRKSPPEKFSGGGEWWPAAGKLAGEEGWRGRVFILRLHKEQRISGFVHGLKTTSLMEFLSTDLPTTYKGLMEKTYTWIEVATNGALSDHKDGFDRFDKGFSWDNSKGNKNNQDRFSPYKGSNHGLLTNLSKSPREILPTEKVAKAFEQPPRMELRHQIEEAVKSGKLAHLVKSNKEGKGKGLYPTGSIASYNLLIGRTTMHKMGIVVSTIHASIIFYTPCVIGTVFSTYEPNKVEEGQKKVKETILEVTKDLPTSFKRKLQDLLRSNTDVFAWTYVDMTGILRTIIVGGKPFNMKHKLNGNKHIEPVQLTKHWLTSAFKEVMLMDIQETFDRLQSINMKLKPKKCSFDFEEGSFLGHLITKQGIKDNPSKVKEITNLKPPKTLKERQSIDGKLEALSRFLSKGADRKREETSFDLLCKKGVTRGRIKLLRINKAHTSSRPCCKKTSKVIPSSLHQGRNSGKRQILADFLAETPSIEDKDMQVKKPEAENNVLHSGSTWKLYTNGASSSDSSGAGLMLVSPEGKEYTYALRFEFETTNNEVEYEAWLAGEGEASNHRKWKAGRETHIGTCDMQIQKDKKQFTKGIFQELTLPRNNQKETPFILTYESKAIIPKVMNLTFEKEESLTQEMAERNRNKEKEVALIEEVYYQNKLQRYHDTRNGRSTFSLGDFVLFSSHNENDQKQPSKKELAKKEHGSSLESDGRETLTSWKARLQVMQKGLLRLLIRMGMYQSQHHYQPLYVLSCIRADNLSPTPDRRIPSYLQPPRKQHMSGKRWRRTRAFQQAYPSHRYAPTLWQRRVPP
ncbi:reverse transcriptase domain-containing protein [Tanacetum coccineum]